MKKPTVAEIEKTLEDFDRKELFILDQERRERFKYQLFRLLNDLPEEKWEEAPELELEQICAIMALQLARFFMVVEQVKRALEPLDIELPEEFGKLPSEAYPDRNVYDVLKELGDKRKSDSPSFDFGSSSSFDDLDFSKGFEFSA